MLFEDDATRSALHGEFNALFDQTIVEDCFRKAIQKYGVPEAVYFDQGKQYKTKWMARTCSKLGIRLLFAKPYSPESKGNEKFGVMRSRHEKGITSQAFLHVNFPLYFHLLTQAF
ncbi:DDE-type integrase/transposase/recombinase [Paenibacillus alkaliterrae]|nr:DDE-type integrase/transposase/recombinase [Paenibacillus alkaliterrae]